MAFTSLTAAKTALPQLAMLINQLHELSHFSNKNIRPLFDASSH